MTDGPVAFVNGKLHGPIVAGSAALVLVLVLVLVLSVLSVLPLLVLVLPVLALVLAPVLALALPLRRPLLREPSIPGWSVVWSTN